MGKDHRTVLCCLHLKTIINIIQIHKMNVLELSEQEIIRRNSLAELRKMGIEPYPAAEYVVTGHSTEIKENFTPSM